MPKVSKDTASGAVSLDGVEVRTEELDGGYTVCFESHTGDETSKARGESSAPFFVLGNGIDL